MPSPEGAPELSAGERTELVAVGRAALLAAVGDATYSPPPLAGRLAAPGASFVTLRRADGGLRGCIGSLEPRRPLAVDVAWNARAAAREDQRFAPVVAAELAGLSFEIALLSPLAPLAARSRRELLAALRPGVDGLLVDDGARRATFLPSVWEELPEPELFLAQLERKAGLAPGGFSRPLRAWRYATASLPLSPVVG
jgi:AmmeMemoRadiSam system protein A